MKDQAIAVKGLVREETRLFHLTKAFRDFFSYAPFLGPFLCLVVLFFFIPVILTTGLAFTGMDSKLEWDFVGLQNFRKLLIDPLVPKIAKNTIIYVFFTCLFFNVGLGFILALLTTYYVKRENVGLLFRSIWLLPRMTPSVVYGLLWLWFLDPSEGGMVNQVLQVFNQPTQSWLARSPMAVIILVNGFVGASFGMVIFSAAIKAIPTDYIWAARVDGASDFDIVRRIIVPLLKWPIMFTTIWQTLSLLSSYEYILILTDGGPFYKSEVWALHAYHRAFKVLSFGEGASVAFVLVVVGVGVCLIMWKLFGFERLMQPSKIEV